tara:strand:- start:99426 stop:99560 length:135 start_codon:yes stop_codon:yes gene_type:complete
MTANTPEDNANICQSCLVLRPSRYLPVTHSYNTSNIMMATLSKV